jgi:hypothetical protein
MNWAERLERAKRKGSFTKTDSDVSADWSSCAVGERSKIGFPELGDKYDQITRLGVDFCQAVEMDDVSKAVRIYKRITSAFDEMVNKK